MITVIDEAIDKEHQDAIEAFLIGGGTVFGWFLSAHTVAYADRQFKEDPLLSDLGQFTHTFIANGYKYSDYLDVINPIFDAIARNGFDVTKILRVKANLSTQSLDSDSGLHRAIHVDYDGDEFITCLYYVNDADGDTIFFDVVDKNVDGTYKEIERIPPKKGRLIIFDGNTFHAAQTQVKARFRCVINFNFFRERGLK